MATGIVTLALAVLAAAPPQGEPMADAAKPGPKFGPLPGRVVGLLVGDVRAVIAAEGRTAPDTAVAFARGNDSYRWLYLKTPGDPDADTLTLPVGPDGKTTKAFDAVRLADAALLKARGVPTPYALVEVEVNGGAGAPAGEEHFVATDLKILDGGREYPLRTAGVVRDLRGRFAE